MIDPIEFLELSQVEGLLELTEEQIAATAPEKCPHRENPVRSTTGKVSARCALLSDESAGDIGVDERTCRVCLCHGKPNPDENAYLARQLVCLAWAHTIAPDMAAPKAAIEAALDLAIENVKRYRDADIAKRFAETLLERGTLADGAALVALLEKHGLVSFQAVRIA